MSILPTPTQVAGAVSVTLVIIGLCLNESSRARPWVFTASFETLALVFALIAFAPGSAPAFFLVIAAIAACAGFINHCHPVQFDARLWRS